MCWALLAATFVTAVSAGCNIKFHGGAHNCWEDDASEPILGVSAPVSPGSFTLEDCAKACQQLGGGYTTLGVEGGATPVCTCGNAPRLPTAQSSGCNVACPGNSNEVCGGSGLLVTLYDFTCVDGPSAAPEGTVPTSKGNPGPAPAPGKKTKDTGSGASSTIFFILLLLIAICVAGYVVTVLVFSFVLKKEGYDRAPGSAVVLNLLGKGPGRPDYMSTA